MLEVPWATIRLVTFGRQGGGIILCHALEAVVDCHPWYITVKVWLVPVSEKAMVLYVSFLSRGRHCMEDVMFLLAWTCYWTLGFSMKKPIQFS